MTASRPELSTAVDQVIGKAMAKAPAGRYGSCASFAADLGRAFRLVPGQIEAVGQGLMPPVASIRRDQRDPSRGPAQQTRRPGDEPPSRQPGDQPPAAGPSMPPGGLARPASNEPPTRKRER